MISSTSSIEPFNFTTLEQISMAQMNLGGLTQEHVIQWSQTADLKTAAEVMKTAWSKALSGVGYEKESDLLQFMSELDANIITRARREKGETTMVTVNQADAHKQILVARERIYDAFIDLARVAKHAAYNVDSVNQTDGADYDFSNELVYYATALHADAQEKLENVQKQVDYLAAVLTRYNASKIEAEGGMGE